MVITIRTVKLVNKKTRNSILEFACGRNVVVVFDNFVN